MLYRFYFETLFSTQPINLAVEEISRNKPIAQTPITIQHNSKLTLMKSGAPFSRADIICMIYLDLKYFSVVCLSIYHEKLAVKTALTMMVHFFTKRLNFCLSYII